MISLNANGQAVFTTKITDEQLPDFYKDFARLIGFAAVTKCPHDDTPQLINGFCNFLADILPSEQEAAIIGKSLSRYPHNQPEKIISNIAKKIKQAKPMAAPAPVG